MILSKRQGIYYATSGLVSPISGPGYVETLTTEDRDAEIAEIQRDKPRCVFLGVGSSAPELGVDLLAALSSYRIVATNDLKTMMYLQPK